MLVEGEEGEGEGEGRECLRPSSGSGDLLERAPTSCSGDFMLILDS